MNNTAQLFTESLFENAPCGLIVMSGDGTILRCNQTFGDWLGYDKTSLLAGSFEQLLTVSGRIFQLTNWGLLMSLQGSVSEVKVDFRHRDGHVLPMLLNGVRREDSNGVSFHLALFGTSKRNRNEGAVFEAMQRAEEILAEKVRAESALRQAQEELAKAYEDAQHRALFAEQMVAVVSHDLKNPMTAIKLATELLQQEPHGERARRLLANVSSSADRAERMIVDLLDFASVRLGKGINIRCQKVNLIEVVDECVAELRGVFGSANIRHYHRGSGDIEVDRDRLHQMLGNLVANSVAYGDLGFPITLTTDLSNGGAVISVHNHGPALDSALIPALFEPMTRGGEQQGTPHSVGLGLFIVRQITEAHSGEISVTSNVTSGTTFSIKFPAPRTL